MTNPVDHPRSIDDKSVARYRVADNISVSISSSRVIVYNYTTRRAVALPPVVSRVLGHCDLPKTLRQHSKQCQIDFALATDDSIIRKTLLDLANNGFMISESELEKALIDLGNSDDQVSIRTVAIPSKDRPNSITRTLQGYAEQITRRRKDLEIIVHDGSNDEVNAEKYIANLRRVSNDLNVGVRYAGIKQRKSYIELLASASSVDQDILEFALIGGRISPEAYGAARNSILLDTINEAIFCVDDDIICKVSPSPNFPTAQTEIELGTGGDPSDVWFFDSFDQALAAASLVDCDLLALHESILGKTLPSINQSEHLNWQESSLQNTTLKSLRTGRGAVRLTQMGLVGDAGISSPSWFGLTGDSLDRWIASESEYNRGLSSRQVIRVPSRCTVSGGQFFMTPAAGYDNRKPLPPFFPSFRNEDGVFAACLRSIEQEDFIAYLPYSVVHKSHRSGMFASDQVYRDVQTCRVSEALIAAIGTFPQCVPTTDSSRKMCRLGQYFEDLSSLSVGEFQEVLLMKIWAMRGSFLRVLEQRYSDISKWPDYFNAGLHRYLESSCSALVSPNYLVLRELRNCSNPEDSLKSLREYFAYFGRLLQCWPAIVNGSSKLRENGCRISVPLD